MAARNVLGGVYQPGKPLSLSVREEIVHLYNQGYQIEQISKDLKITGRGVRKILDHVRTYETVTPFATGGSKVRVMRGNILDVIEIWKLQKPSIYTAEIRERLFLEGTCTQYNFRLSTLSTKVCGTKLVCQGKKFQVFRRNMLPTQTKSANILL